MGPFGLLAAGLNEGKSVGSRLHYLVDTADPVIGFESDGWTRYMTLHGDRAFKIGGSCETCAFFFERIESLRLSPTQVSERLALGSDLLGDDLIETVSALLPAGDYAVVETTIEPTSTRPYAPNDYFSHESIDLFGMPSYSGVANDPRIPYWRAGSWDFPSGLSADHRPGPHIADPTRVFHFVVPMEPPQHFDKARVAHYRAQLESGVQPVALGLSVLDVRAPAVTPWDKYDDPNYEWGHHWCLATYVLDGHHKIEAAAQSGRPIGLLTFISRKASVALENDVDLVVSLLSSD